MNLSSSESTPRMRGNARASAGVMVAVAAAATLTGRGLTVVVPPILPIVVGSVIVTELMSAYVLFAEFKRERTTWLGYLGSAYLFSACVAIPYIIAFPGIFSPGGILGANGQAALYLWLAWHGGFPLIIMLAVVAGGLPADRRVSPGRSGPTIAIAVAACIAFAAAVPFLLARVGPALPALIDGTHFTAVVRLMLLPAVIVLDGCAIVVLVARTRARSAISVWLALAVLASLLDTLMGLICDRYTLGWYAGKAFMMASSTVMLAGFIGELSRLRTRLIGANEELQRTREHERRTALERLASATSNDALTGLATRSRLEERLQQLVSAAKRDASRFAVFFIGLDAFKSINGAYGLHAGDEVLAEAARRIAGIARRSDIVARFGSDEFVVAGAVADGHEAASLAERLAAELSAPYRLSDVVTTIRSSASIGIALFPDDGASAELVLDGADAAAHRAKRDGTGTLCFYSRAFVDEARSRNLMYEELVGAISRAEFTLYYQPIVHLRTNETSHVEALIRWNHPRRGLLSPGEFLPVAEQTDLMAQIGRWVIEEATCQSAAWRDSGTPMRIAFNVSSRQLEDRGFLEHLQRTIERHSVAPSAISIEVTESVAMADASVAYDVLSRCRALGFGVALDDFGTYYSSLTYLKRLPIDTVKIDRSFVQGLPFSKDDAAIVDAVLGLAASLERTVVAEGIETEAQRVWLARANCTFGQGFLFARPMSAIDFAGWKKADFRRSRTTA